MIDPNVLWIGPFLGWAALEAWALAMRRDRMQPNTYWIRKAPWVARAIAIVGLTGFLIAHFLLCGAACS